MAPTFNYSNDYSLPIDRKSVSMNDIIVREINCFNLPLFFQSSDKKEKVSDRATVTKSEAISFVEGVLGIPNPVVSANEDPWGFLCNIQKKMKTSVSFTNLVYFNEHGAHNFFLEESKRVVFTKQGGACFDVYPVVQAVLRHLGFDISLKSCSLSTVKTQLPVSHVGLLVKNVTYPGSLHFLEPGTRHPISRI